MTVTHYQALAIGFHIIYHLHIEWEKHAGRLSAKIQPTFEDRLGPEIWFHTAVASADGEKFLIQKLRAKCQELKAEIGHERWTAYALCIDEYLGDI